MSRARPRAANPIDVIEAAYDLERDEQAWLTGLLARIRPLLDDGLGLFAYRFDLARPCASWFDSAAVVEFDRALFPLVIAAQTESPRTLEYAHSIPDALNTARGLSDWWPVELASLSKLSSFYSTLGAMDWAVLQTVEPSGRGIVFNAGQRRERTFAMRTRRLWRRVAAHIAAGRRLRDSLAAGATSAEAVLTPSGRVEHAEEATKSASVREALRDGVLRQERARGRGRRDDPEGATGAWTALVSGRWSLVDRFERGGRRYIVARRNELQLPDPRKLTAREHAIVQLAALGKANKLIAYELGFSESTVSTQLSTAMRKLGVRTRVELVALVAQLR